MDLAERMESYEDVSHGVYLIPRLPTIIRVDGRAFHGLLKSAEKPFCQEFATQMNFVAKRLLGEIQNARFAYIQSDEISLLLIDYNKFDTQQWFGGNREKMVSVSASIASANLSLQREKECHFDSRVFTLPEREVVNYFIWRQRDWERNSIQMVARCHYSHKQLNEKNKSDMQEMIFQKDDNWNNYATPWKRGRIATIDHIDGEIPIFSKDRGYIEKFMEIEDV